MKVLLTGGSGNLGRTLLPKLLDKGDTPVVLDIRAPRHFKNGGGVYRGVDSGPSEPDRDISWLQLHSPHRRLARHPRRSRREKRLRFLRPQCPRHLRGFRGGGFRRHRQDHLHFDDQLLSAGYTVRQQQTGYYDLALSYGLDPQLKPTRLDISETVRWLGYKPSYSLANLLSELAAYGDHGPPQIAEAL